MAVESVLGLGVKNQASEYCKFYKADVGKGIFYPVSDWIKAKE